MRSNLFHKLWSRLTSARRRRWAHGQVLRVRNQRRRALLEALEPRKLMATLAYQVDSPAAYLASNPNALLDGDVDLSLRIANVGGTPMLQLVDFEKDPLGQVVAASDFNSPITVIITGYSTSVQGKTEELPESLLIDLGNTTGLNIAPVSIDVTVNGIQGTVVPLLNNDTITIAPSAPLVYSPASLSVALNDGEKISVSGPLVAQGSVALTSKSGNIEVLAGGSITAGDITLAASNDVTAQGDADSLDALLQLAPAITINNGSLTGNNISLSTTATGNVTISSTDLRNGQFNVGEVVAIANSSIAIDGNSQINANGNLSLVALTNITTLVTRGAQADGNANDDDRDEDAAIAFSAITSSAGIGISGTSQLTAGGQAKILATNYVNVTTTADGTLQNGSSGGNAAGGTLATATLVGDTEVVISDAASITAVGDLLISAASDRTVVTTSKATPKGATDDGDSNTQTQGQQALANNNASTADGDMKLAAAIAVNTVMGETRALVTGGTLTSTTGNVGIHSSASHHIQTIADGTTATGQGDTGVGVAVAIGLAGVTDPTGATVLRSTANVRNTVAINAKSLTINADTPQSTFDTQAIAGPSGPSQDANGNDTGADIGVAGALAIGVTLTNTEAAISPAASLNTNGADVTVLSQSTTNSTVHALPKDDPVSGASLGLGAGVAVNINDHTTRATLADGATLTGADDVNISASSFHGLSTEGQAGAAGGTALAAAVAIELGHNDTLAELGSGNPLTATGNVQLLAVHVASNTAQAAGDAEGASDAAIGAAFAMSLHQDKTEALVRRSLTSGGKIDVQAIGNTSSSATATASAQGETDDGSEDDANAQANNQRNSANSQASARGARTSANMTSNPDASTSEGEITVAAAIALNINDDRSTAAIGDGLSISADGPLSVKSTRHSNASAVADGSATQSQTGVGVAVAINAAKSNNTATIGAGTNVSADGVMVQAIINDAIDTMSATAVSGAGASDVGVAGSLAINMVEVNTLASLKTGAVVTVVDGSDVGTNVGATLIEALSLTNNKSSAAANATGDTGVGASIAFNITDLNTQAEINSSVILSGAHDLSVTATSKHDVLTQAEGGAAGGTAFTPVATATLAFSDTQARIKADSAALAISGALLLSAQQSGSVEVDATGKTQGSDAAIGASLAVTYVEEQVIAQTERSLTTGGQLTIATNSNTIHTTNALASASGAEGQKKNSGGTAQEKSDQLRKSGNNKSKTHSGADSGEENKATATTANKDGDSQGDAVTVAAAIAVSIVESTVRAEISDGIVIQAGGLLTVSSIDHNDASAQADGSAVQGGTSIGAAVAINVVEIEHQAVVGASQVTADGLVVEAIMLEPAPGTSETHSFIAQAKSGAGGEDVGVAGSLAINHVELDNAAYVRGGADVMLSDGADVGSGIGPLSIHTQANTNNQALALPDVIGGGAQSGSVGVGASVAVNLTYLTSRAEIEDEVDWSGGSASQVAVAAQADHTLTTTAENGAAAGEVGIGGAVAVAISKNKTTARLGHGTGAIQTNGPATVQAEHKNKLATNVSSKATGEDAAIGASVGVVIVEDAAQAEVARDLQATGAVVVKSQMDAESLLNVKASAGGGDSGGNDADTEATHQANQPNASQQSDNTVPAAKEHTDDANQQSSEESSNSGGSVGIAASVAVNALSLTNSASISHAANVVASGAVTVSAPAHIISRTEADSSAIDTSGGTSIGAAVALNWVSLTNSAEIGEHSLVMGQSITVEAITTDNQTNDFLATAFAVAGNTGDTAVAGVVALNVVDADTTARLADNAHVVSSGKVDVIAEHDMRVQAAAIAGTVSDGVSLAAAVALNIVGLNEDSETGGSQTVASIGDSTAGGMAASVAAAAGVNVSASHHIGMFPVLNLPDSLNHPQNPDYAIEDINEPVASVAISGGGSTGNFAAAGSVSINLLETTTHALIDHSVTVGSDSLSVIATDTINLVTLAGAVGAAADGAGLGLGLDLNIIHKDTLATIGKQSTINTDHNVVVAANSTESLNSYAVTLGVGNSAGLAGSASVQVVETTTQATVQDGSDASDGAAITSGGAVSITATGIFSTRMVAGAVGAAGSTGVGASNTTLVHNDLVAARVGDYSRVDSASGMSVVGNSSENLLTIAAAGGAAGTVGVAGAAVVNVLNESTSATIGDGADVQLDNGFLPGAAQLLVSANDATNIVSVGGSLAAAGSVGAGIGADVGTVNKHTLASIGSGVVAEIEGNLLVTANSSEDVTSAAAGLAASGSAAISLDASVHVYDITTRAFIGDDPTDAKASLGAGKIHAAGSVLVAADDQNEIDKVVGVLAASGGAAIAGGAAVSTVTKHTEAFIGDQARVTGDGKNTPVNARTGRFITTFAPASTTTTGLESNSTLTAKANLGDLQVQGEVGLPDVDNIDVNQDNGSDTNDPSLTGQRTLQPEELIGFRGVAVTATNRDDIEDYTLSLAGSTVAIAVSAGVNVINNTTRAYIGQQAQINIDTSTAHSDQAVQVAAGSDLAHVAFAGSVAGGVVGIGPAADVSVFTINTEAYLGWDANNKTTAAAAVNAKQDVSVAAHATEDVLLVGVGVAGGLVGIGAGVDVLVFNNHTRAAIGTEAQIAAGANVIVNSTDESDIDIISGGGGGGLAGAGGAVGILSLSKDTQAWIDSGAVVDAQANGLAMNGVYSGQKNGSGQDFTTTSARGVIVQAHSSEDVLHLAIAVGAGFVGVAGGVTVSLLDSDTQAVIGDDAQINQHNNGLTNNRQSVWVNAFNEARVATFAGAVAGGFGAVGGAVDFGTLKNDTQASIGGDAHVAAQLDVEVNALGIKDLDDFAFSGSGGAIALAGAVSIWSIGTALRQTYSDELGNQAKAGERKDGAADKDAAKQAELGRNSIASGLGGFQADPKSNAKSNSARVSQITSLAGASLMGNAPSQSQLDDSINSLEGSAGTTASIGDFAVVTAGQDITVNADEIVDMDVAVGGLGGGLAGFGAAVGVLTVAANASAYSGGNLAAGGTVAVTAWLDESGNALALAGGAGFVGLGAAVFDMSDSSTVQAAVGTVTSAQDITVLAYADQSLSLETGQLGAGGLAGGASFTTLQADGQIAASVLGGAQIGQQPGLTVGSLSLTADSNLEAHNKTTAVAFGGQAVSSNFARSTVAPQVAAGVGVGANISLAGNTTVQALAEHDALAEVLTLTGGAISIGTSFATAELAGQVSVDVANAATIEAANITLEARLNHTGQQPSAGQATATAQAPSPVPVPGVAAGTGTVAVAKANTNVVTSVGEATQLKTSTGNVALRAFGSHVADAEALAVSLGLAASVGVSDATATADGYTQVKAAGGIDSAGGLTVAANARNHATSHAEAAAVALGGSGAGALAKTFASPKVAAQVDADQFVLAKGNIAITAVADNLSQATGDGGAAGIAGIGEVQTTATADGQIDALSSADLRGQSLIVSSNATNLVTATGTSATGGLLASGNGVTAKTHSAPKLTAKVDTKARVNTTVTVAAGLVNTPTAFAGSLAISGGAAGGGTSATNVSQPSLAALVTGTVVAPTALNITATDMSTIDATAGGATLGLLGGAYGMGLATNVVAGETTAAIRSGLHTAGTVNVLSTETVLIHGQADGVAAGAAAIAGAKVVNDVGNATTAEIANDVFINPDQPGTGNVTVKATDATDITGTVDQLGIAAAGAAGAALTFNGVASSVKANVQGLAHVNTLGNLLVIADSNVSVHDTTVGVNVAAGGGSSANSAINVLETDVAASIAKQSSVAAGNNVLVQANSDNQLTVNTTSGAGGLLMGSGGTVVVNTFDSRTRAFIDEASIVSALGNGPSLTVNKWDQTGKLSTHSLNGLAVIAHSSSQPADDLDGGGPELPLSVRGANASGGLVGLNSTSVINTIDDLTEAFIASSTINSNTSPGEDVIVRAHSDQLLRVDARGVAGGLGGVSGVINRSDIASQTRAFISDNDESGKDLTNLAASVIGKNVEVSSVSKKNIDYTVKGVTGGGLAVADAASVATLAATNQAFIRDSAVKSIATNASQGDLTVVAHDIADINGTVSADSAGGFGAGTSVGFNTIKNVVQARLLGGNLVADQNLSITANSVESINTQMHALGAGGLAGLAGSVVVNTIETTTEATVGDGDLHATINDQPPPATGLLYIQSVTIAAHDTAHITNNQGTLAGGGVAGIGAAVESSNIRNRTVADIGPSSTIRSTGDITVAAVGERNLDSKVSGFGGGLVGLSGATSLLTLGAPTAGEINSLLTEFLKTDKNGSSLEEQTNQPAQTPDVALGVPDKPGSDSYSILQKAAQRVGALSKPDVVEALTPDSNDRLTAALIESAPNAAAKTQLDAGGDISVTALNTYTVNQTVGTTEVGLVGKGARIGQSIIRNATQATLGDFNTLEASGDVTIQANDVNSSATPVAITSYGGAAGLVALGSNVADLTLDSQTSARIGKHAEIVRGEAVSLGATQVAHLKSTAKGYGGAGFAAAGSVELTPTVTTTTTATIDDQAIIGGERAVANLTTTATSVNQLINELVVANVAGAGAVSHGTDQTVINPTTSAHIGAAHVDVRGAAVLSAVATQTVNGTIESIAAGGFVGDGAGTADVTIEGSTTSDIAANAQVKSGALTVAATQFGTIDTMGQAIGGGLVGGIAAGARGHIDMNVLAQVAAATLNSDDFVTVQADSTASVIATSGSLGVVGVGKGGSTAEATIVGQVAAHVLSGTSITAGRDVKILANANNSAQATSQATSAGIINGSAAETLATVDVDTLAAFVNSTLTTAGNIQVQAQATNTADADSIGATASLLGAVGHVESTALIEGSTRALADGSIHSTAGFIRVQAHDESSHAIASGKAAGAGIGLSVTATTIQAKIQPSADDPQAQVRARLAGNVSAAGDIAVRAKSTDAAASATANGVALAGGVASGGTDALAVLGQTLRASIGNGSTVTGGQDIKVEASNTADWSTATASATGGALLAGLAGAKATAQAVASVTSVIGDATVDAAGMLRVHADSTNLADATGDGIAIGLVLAKGDVHADATAGKATQAGVQSGADLQATDIVVEAISGDRGKSDVVGTGGGLVSASATQANTFIAPQVSAYLGDNVKAQAAHDILLSSDARAEGDADASANSFGAVAIGEARAHVDLKPNSISSVGINSHLDAGHDVNLKAIFGQTTAPDGSGTTRAEAKGASASAFVGVLATKATVDARPVVKTLVAEKNNNSGPTISAAHDILLTASSQPKVLAIANNAALSLTASHGHSIANAELDDTAVSQVGTNAELISGNNLTITALTVDRSQADAHALAGSIIDSAARAESKATIDHQTLATVAGAQLTAGQLLTIQSTSDTTGISSADADSGSLVSSANANAGTDAGDLEVGGSRLGTVILGTTTTTIGEQSLIKARDILLAARIERSDGESISSVHTAVGPADIDGLSRVELYDDALVSVLSGAQIAGEDTVSLLAESKSLRVYSDTVTKVDGVGGATSDAIGHVDVDARVTTNDAALITTHDLEVQALGLTGSVSYHNVATATGTTNGANEKGDFDPDRIITFDADVVLTSGKAVLVIGPTGAVLEQENITYHISGNTIVVHDITNQDPGSVLFQTNTLSNAPLGTVRSESVRAAQAAGAPLVHGVGPLFTFKETFDEVLIENQSDYNLQLGNIGVVNKTEQPEITIDTQTLLQVVIVNPAPVIKEVFGFDVKHDFDVTHIEITDPSVSPSLILINGLIDNPIGTTNISNAGGAITRSLFSPNSLIRTNDLSIDAAGNVGTVGRPLRVQLVQSANRPANLNVHATGNLQLDLQGLIRQPGTSLFILDGATLDAADVNLILRDALLQTTLDPNVSYLVDVHETHPVQTTPVENRFRPAQPGLDSLTKLDLGIFGIGLDAANADYKFDQLQSSGNINVTSPAAAKQVSLEANTNIIGNGKIDANLTGDIKLFESSGALPVGLITSTGGDVELSVAAGSIVDIDNDAAADVVARNITLQAPLGSIGTAANPLDINSSNSQAGELNATALGGLDVVETVGNLNLGLVSASQGNVSLQTLNGSIVDAHDDAAVNVKAKDITLVASGGPTARLAEAGDPLEICASGVVSLVGPGGMDVHNACGPLKIVLLQANLGFVSISSVGKLELMDGATVVAAAGANFSSESDIEFAATARLQAGGAVTVRAGTAATEGATGAKIIMGGHVDAPQLDVFGGRGHDTIVVGDPVLMRINGGTGLDTLQLRGQGLLLDLTRMPDNRLQGLESIDITGSGHNTLALDLQSVLELSDESDTLIVRRNKGDTVNKGTGWAKTGNEIIDGSLFEVFRQGAATLKIQAIAATVTGRHIFYNNSFFDGFTPDASASDDTALAPDKTPLLSGKATAANYTNYSRGINGIMIDIAGLPTASLTAQDFEFRVGNSNTPANWERAPEPLSITVRPGAGADGAARVTIIWRDNAIQKQWLQIVAKATDNTGLETADVFYFGNAIGDVQNSPLDAIVNATDLSAIVSHQNSFRDPAAIDSLYDVNRDRLINATDIATVAANQTSFLQALRLIDVGVASHNGPAPIGVTNVRLSAAPRNLQTPPLAISKRQYAESIDHILGDYLV